MPSFAVIIQAQVDSKVSPSDAPRCPVAWLAGHTNKDVELEARLNEVRDIRELLRDKVDTKQQEQLCTELALAYGSETRNQRRLRNVTSCPTNNTFDLLKVDNVRDRRTWRFLSFAQ